MSKQIIIFVDADAFVAFAKDDDSNHERAKQIFAKLQDFPITFITSNHIFAEVATVLSQKVNHATAVEFVYSMKAEDNVFQIERIGEKTEDAAIQHLEQIPSNRPKVPHFEI